MSAKKTYDWLRAHAPYLTFWTIVWGATFLSLLSGRERLPTSDFGEQFHAFAHFQAQEWWSGRLPLWSTGSYGGFPFFADPQSGAFYLPRLLNILFSFNHPLSYYALQFEALLHVWLTGVFTYFFALRETHSRAGALLAAIGFGLGGYLLGYPILQLAILESITWLPLILICIHGLTTAPDRLARQRWSVAAGLALSMSAMAGHPQTLLHIVYATISYFVWRAVRAGWSWRSGLRYSAFSVALAIACSAPTWLPALRYAATTSRASVNYDFTATGLPLLDYLQVALPNTLSLWVPQYAGIASLLLAVMALLHGGSNIRFWATVALIAGWLGLGDQGILYEAAYRFLPGVALFRQQERWLAIFNFSLVLLAAHGAALLPRLDRRIVVRAGGVVAAMIAVGLLILSAGSALRPAGWIAGGGLQILIGVGSFGLMWLIRKKRAAWVVLFLLLFADLYLATSAGIGRVPDAPSDFWAEPQWIETLRSNDSRIDTQNLFWSNFGERYGLPDAAGISPLKPGGLELFEHLPAARRWSLLGTTHFIGGSIPEGVQAEPLQSIENVKRGSDSPVGKLYKLENPVPSARVLFEAIVEPDQQKALDLLKSESFDPRTQTIVPAAVDLPAVQSPVEVDLQVVKAEPSQMEFFVESASPGILVISNWYYPGWRVTVSGNEATLLAANHVQQGVKRPAGSSRVIFTYRPPELFAGGLFALTALIVAIILVAFPIPRISLVKYRPAPFATPVQIHWRTFPALLEAVSRQLGKMDARYAFVLILLLAGALRLNTAATQDLRGDEAFTVAVTNNPASEIVATLRSSNDPHPPLHYFLIDSWREMGGDSEFSLRMSSVWLSLLLLAFTTRLAFDVATRQVGLLTALLMAVSQSLVWLGHDVRNQYLLALCFGLLAGILLWRRRPWWMYGAAAVLTMYSHYFGIFILLSHGVLLLATKARRRDFWKWTATGSIAALLFLPWLMMMFGTTVASQLSEPTAIDLGEHILRVGKEVVVGNAFTSRIWRWLFLASLLLIIWRARRWRNESTAERPGTGVWLLAWIGFTVLGLFIIRLNRSIYNTFYAVMAAPAWWLLLSGGVIQLWRNAAALGRAGRLRGRSPVAALASTALVLCLLGANAISDKNYFTDTVAYGRDRGYQDLAAQLEANAGPEDLVIFHAPDPSLAYYLRDLDLAHTLLPSQIGMSEAEINRQTADTVTMYPRVWFVPAERGVYDPTDAVTRWLDYHLLHEQYYQFESLQLRAYRPVSTAPEVMRSMNTQWANGMRLRGLHLTQNGEPVSYNTALTLTSEDELAVTLLWQTDKAVVHDYVVFVHLLDEQGALLAQHDGVPLFGTRPTSSWQPGERLLDRHVIHIDYAGQETSAKMVLGLYDSTTLERVPTANGAAAIPLFPEPISVRPTANSQNP